MDGVGHRLFNVHVLARFDRGHGGYGMNMIGCRHKHGVDSLLLFEHHPEVTVATRVGISFERVGRPLPVDVTQRDDVLRFKVSQVAAALPTNADTGNVELLTRSPVPGSTENGSRQNRNPRKDVRKRATAA